MIAMAKQQYIKHLYENEEKSLREIARLAEVSQQTAAKYAYQEKWDDAHLPNCTPEKHPVLQDFIKIIDEWLENDRREPRKQRHTVVRIYKRLQDEHQFQGSYTSLKNMSAKRSLL